MLGCLDKLWSSPEVLNLAPRQWDEAGTGHRKNRNCRSSKYFQPTTEIIFQSWQRIILFLSCISGSSLTLKKAQTQSPESGKILPLVEVIQAILLGPFRQPWQGSHGSTLNSVTQTTLGSFQRANFIDLHFQTQP